MPQSGDGSILLSMDQLPHYHYSNSIPDAIPKSQTLSDGALHVSMSCILHEREHMEIKLNGTATYEKNTEFRTSNIHSGPV